MIEEIEARLAGATIERVEHRTIDGTELVLHFGRDGEEEGFIVAPLAQIYFNDGGYQR